MADYPIRGLQQWAAPLKAYIDGAADSAVDQVADDINDPESDLGRALSTSTVARVNPTQHAPALGLFFPEAEGATKDGTDDSEAIQAAVDAAALAGGGQVMFQSAVYRHTGVLRPRSGVIWKGVPGTVLACDSAIDGIVNDPTEPLRNVVFDGLRFEGKALMPDPEVPTRQRAVTGDGYQVAIDIRGSLAAEASGWETAPEVENVTIRDCTFHNTKELPYRIFGVTGVARADGNYAINCKDPGFGYNADLIVNENYSYMSSDNGFSISRGNRNVTISNNVSVKSAYAGIWVSGWIGYDGPRRFTVTGNVVEDCGWQGISLIDAPKTGVVTGNTLFGNYRRGASDHTDDFKCVGIRVTGTPSTDLTAPTSYAENLIIANNAITGFARGGIFIDGLLRGRVTDNLIVDCGSATAASGNAIPSTSTTQNIGIMVEQAAHIVDVVIAQNQIIDSRPTPYLNRGVIVPATATGVTQYLNVVRGARAEPDSNPVPATLAGSTGQAKAPGRYYGAPPAGGATVALTAGHLWYVPLILAESGAVARLAARVTVPASGATIRLGLYRAAVTSGAPDTLVAETAALPAEAVGDVESGITTGALPAGRYWLAIVAQGEGVTVQGATAVVGQLWRGQVQSSSTAAGVLSEQSAGYRATGVTGALPATAAGVTGQNSDVPRIAWRWA